MPQKLTGDINAQLQFSSEILRDISDTPRLDAELLMAHALGFERSEMLMRRHELEVPDTFQALIDRRAQYEPIAYIIGQQDFWDITLIVTPDVLIPRADSETMIEWIAELYNDNPPRNILDLGTGSGALLLAALSVFKDARGIGIDKSGAAINIAQQNGMKNNMDERCQFLFGDWRQSGWEKDILKDECFDMILCNPPYIAVHEKLMRDVEQYEPKSALFAGDRGLDDYQILIPDLHKILTDDATIFLEIGADQANDVTYIAKECGYLTKVKQDLTGLNRILMLKRIVDC